VTSSILCIFLPARRSEQQCGGHKMTCGHCRRDSLFISTHFTSSTGGCSGFKQSFPSLKKSVSLVGLFWTLLNSVFTASVLFFVVNVPHFAFCFYLQHTTQTSMPPAGFELPIPASKRSQIYALVRAATGIGTHTPRFRRAMPYLF
jgi:hypothetical protein